MLKYLNDARSHVRKIGPVLDWNVTVPVVWGGPQSC